jgi:hypothetical protein
LPLEVGGLLHQFLIVSEHRDDLGLAQCRRLLFECHEAKLSLRVSRAKRNPIEEEAEHLHAEFLFSFRPGKPKAPVL